MWSTQTYQTFSTWKLFNGGLGGICGKKTTKGFIFKPLTKVFKLRILSGCWGLVLFSIEFYKVSKCAIASANFQFGPPGADQKTFYLYIFPFLDNIQQFPHNFFWKYWKIRSQYLDILSFWSILKVISWDEVFPGVIFTDREMSVLKKRVISAWRFHLQKKGNVGLKTATFCKHSLIQCMSTPISWHLESRLPEVWWSISTSEVKPPVPQKYFQEFPIFQIKAKIATRKLRRWEEYLEVICALPRVENKEGGLIVNFEQKYKSFSFQIKTNANSKC